MPKVPANKPAQRINFVRRVGTIRGSGLINLFAKHPLESVPTYGGAVRLGKLWTGGTQGDIGPHFTMAANYEPCLSQVNS